MSTSHRIPLRALIATLVVLHSSCLIAGPRSSTSYTLITDAIGAGGEHSTSAAYTNDGSAGGMTGLATAASPAQTMKSGYIAQLTDATALQLAASPLTMDEGGTRQLSASLLNDDLTTTGLLATAVSWGVQSGPVSSVTAGGLATAGVVYQNTDATVSGLHATFSSTLTLSVLNVNTDDLPGYSGDGIDDAWQFQYFGLNNPLAAPGAVTDGTGLTNLFKFTAGLIPNNSASKFTFDPQAVPAAPGQMKLVIHPRLADRTYTIRTSTTLGTGAVWTTLTGHTISDNGLTRTITDTDASGARKFYRVEILKP